MNHLYSVELYFRNIFMEKQAIAEFVRTGMVISQKKICVKTLNTSNTFLNR